jgi:hypothetical protein
MTEAQSSRMLQRHVSNSCPIAMINATADDLQNLQQAWLSHSNIMQKILIELQFIFETKTEKHQVTGCARKDNLENTTKGLTTKFEPRRSIQEAQGKKEQET